MSIRSTSRSKSRSTSEVALENRIFLGRDADAFSTLVAKQIEAVFAQVGIIIPVKSCSLLSSLATIEPASAADLAKALGQSHQLILQKIPALLDSDLILRGRDAKDGRRKIFSLTAEGKLQLDRLRKLSPAIATIYAELYDELGVDLRAALEEASRRLRERTLMERIDALGIRTD